MPSIVYKICRSDEWAKAEQAGAFHGSEADSSDGYIHLSAADQVVGTAAKHFAGIPDLVLVAVDGAALGAALKWESARGGALFPHLYAPLPVNAVVWTRPLPIGPDGRHIFPECVS